MRAPVGGQVQEVITLEHTILVEVRSIADGNAKTAVHLVKCPISVRVRFGDTLAGFSGTRSVLWQQAGTEVVLPLQTASEWAPLGIPRKGDNWRERP